MISSNFFLLLLLKITLIQAKCEIKAEPGMPNRTLCTVDKLDRNDPIEFKKQNDPDFLYVDVSHGGIPKHTFSELKSHKELWFIGTNITHIQPGAFHNLTDLDNLAITNTLISRLAPNSFVGVPNLKILSLVGNKIEHVDEGAFNGLRNVQQFLFSDNKLRRIDETTFRGLEGVQILNLDDNPIEYIHPNAFRGMKNLRRLVISLRKDKNVDEQALDFLDDSQKVVHYVK